MFHWKCCGGNEQQALSLETGQDNFKMSVQCWKEPETVGVETRPPVLVGESVGCEEDGLEEPLSGSAWAYLLAIHCQASET